jgi:hypothetical protein
LPDAWSLFGPTRNSRPAIRETRFNASSLPTDAPAQDLYRALTRDKDRIDLVVGDVISSPRRRSFADPLDRAEGSPLGVVAMARKTTRRKPPVSVDNYRESPLYPGIVRAVATILARSKFVAPVDVVVELGRLTPKALEDWRRGRIPYLEKVVSGNLSRLSKLLRILRFHAHELNLVPSITVYMHWGKGPRQRLRFSKTGDPRLEEAYSGHFVRPGKRPFFDHAAERLSPQRKRGERDRD